MTVIIAKSFTHKWALALVASLSLMLPALSWGAQNCDKPINGFDGLYCLTKVYLEADAELNSSYAKVNKLLNASQKSKLKKGQIAWIRERDNKCSYEDEDGFYINMGCATRRTTDRVNFLNDRLRECKAGSCRDSRLGE